MQPLLLLGDEAVALGALQAGLSAAYAYPGTPSTEIVEYLLRLRREQPQLDLQVGWCANEKSAYESALGTCAVGKRALVAMKHVGLNVAADPFVSSALLPIKGGLVLAVADDPGQHSSQNEQDSRLLADFAKIPCLEPMDPQQAADMTAEAFALSERLELPVMLRLVTRVAHTRAPVLLPSSRPARPLRKLEDRNSWILLPSNSRLRWRALLEKQSALQAWSEQAAWNTLTAGNRTGHLVIATGLARSYVAESLAECTDRPSVLGLATYPPPEALLRRALSSAEHVLVMEEGFPFVERLLRGILPSRLHLRGKMDGSIPSSGELTTEIARAALELPPLPTAQRAPLDLPPRIPQLCRGCPHGDSFASLREALSEVRYQALVTSDIGCYTLGALPPHEAIDTCVCMGASLGMAKGAAEAGLSPVVAVIGDSTFLHSGMQPLLDITAAKAPVTVIILDNEAVAMTGAQQTIAPSPRLRDIAIALGVEADHCKVIEAHPRAKSAMAALFKEEIAYPGPSVIIAVRPCLEIPKERKAAAKGGSSS